MEFLSVIHPHMPTQIIPCQLDSEESSVGSVVHLLFNFFEMGRDLFRHLEHVDLLGTNDTAKFLVWVDLSFFFGILKLVLLDVFPKFLRNFCAGHWAFADDFCEGITDLNRFHQR